MFMTNVFFKKKHLLERQLVLIRQMKKVQQQKHKPGSGTKAVWYLERREARWVNSWACMRLNNTCVMKSNEEQHFWSKAYASSSSSEGELNEHNKRALGSKVEVRKKAKLTSSNIVFFKLHNKPSSIWGNGEKNTETRNFMNFVASATEHIVLCFFISPMRSEALTRMALRAYDVDHDKWAVCPEHMSW